jgi:hypothetical protein
MADAMTVHRIDILPDKRGYGRPAMIYNGKPVGKSNSPIYAAARWLLDQGAAQPADTVETWGSDGILSMYGIAGELAKWTVVEDDDGLHLRRWRPFPAGAVGSRTAKVPLDVNPGISPTGKIPEPPGVPVAAVSSHLNRTGARSCLRN